MKITVLNGKALIETPYDKNFVTKIKTAGASWNAASRGWEMDARFIDKAREIMREVYGRDDSPISTADTVSIRVKVTAPISELLSPVTMFGRTIASAYGRDSGAKVGQGVCFDAGKADSGGSAKNWRTLIDEGSIIVIHDVSRQMVEDGKGFDPTWGTYEVIEAPAPVDPRAALKAEKKALLMRLAEINDELDELAE